MKTFNKISVSVVFASLAFGFAGFVISATTVNLGTAENFAILANTAVTNTGASVINGNIGLSPSSGSNYSGLSSGNIAGIVYGVDGSGPTGSVASSSLLTTAKNDLVTAYNNAGGQATVSTVATELGGTARTPGVYDSPGGVFNVNGTLTLDAQGDPNAVFIFKVPSTLVTGNSSAVSLVNRAQACNVFWQVGGSATLGANSTFKGNILASNSITLGTGANVEGRLMAQTGSVTLDNSVVTRPQCTNSAPVVISTIVTPSGTTTTITTSPTPTTTITVTPVVPFTTVTTTSFAPVATTTSVGFPFAGISPQESSVSWSMVLLIGILIAGLFAMIAMRRRA